MIRCGNVREPNTRGDVNHTRAGYPTSRQSQLGAGRHRVGLSGVPPFRDARRVSHWGASWAWHQPGPSSLTTPAEIITAALGGHLEAHCFVAPGSEEPKVVALHCQGK